jgi:uncharacterized protein (TIGR00288 family)
MDKIHNIALFIDGDNVNKSTFQENFDEIKLKGRMCIKRIYFDFNVKLDDKWKNIILSNGIESICVTNLPGKNSTDMRLMLDAIKEYYSNQIIDTFIIMSSDSDFYHIATFLRSCGKKVICYGEAHTPPMLKNVCDEFVLCKIKKKNENKKINVDGSIQTNLPTNLLDEENLYQELRQIDLYSISKSEIKNNKWSQYLYYKEYKNRIYILKDIIETIKLINENNNLENKNLSALKDLLIRADSSFSEKNWGFTNFKDFIVTLISDIVQTSLDSDKRIEIIIKINI